MQPTLWSKVFKNELEMGHNLKAYKAMMGNPDTSRLVVFICLVVFLYVWLLLWVLTFQYVGIVSLDF